jgi:2OG-Fe(II) oxygenase superfamily
MTINDRLAIILDSLDRRADFCVSGKLPFHAPGLTVEGVGPVALPLLPAQAARLIAAAERAPFGRGSETVIDTDVRRCWRIEAERVGLTGRYWTGTLDEVLERVREGLGLTARIGASLYQLLIYEPGDFFVPHRDTEKVPGMFGTLIVVLPSDATGGDLAVRHKGSEICVDMTTTDPAEIAFAAFYADCPHEVAPIRSGHRLTLVYNLVRLDRGTRPVPADHTEQQSAIGNLLHDWAASRADANAALVGRTPDRKSDGGLDGPGDALTKAGNRLGVGSDLEHEPKEVEAGEDRFDNDEWLGGDEEFEEDDDLGSAGLSLGEDLGPPEKLVRLLDHAYTPAALAFDALKGADAAEAAVLRAACAEAGWHLNLALFSFHEQGGAEYTGGWGRQRRGRDEGEADFEMTEAFEQFARLSHWVSADGGTVPFGQLLVADGETVPSDISHRIEDAEVSFREATGNEGASYERSYQRGALVFWPADRTMAVLRQAGHSVAIPYLADQIARWEMTGDKLLHEQAIKLSGHLLEHWPERVWHAGTGDAPSNLAQVLDLVTRLGEVDQVEALLRLATAVNGHDRADNPALVRALTALPTERAGPLLTRLITAHATRSMGACGALLASAAVAGSYLTGAAAEALLYVLSTGQPEAKGWDRIPIDGSAIADTITGLLAASPAHAARAVALVLADPKRFEIDATVLAAVRILIEPKATRGTEPVARLRDACLDHLRARIALPLEPPSDWRREATVGCRCSDCSALSQYLDDPTRQVWEFRAVEAARSHVEHTIRVARCDIDTSTLKRGRPYTLVCRKNQASHKRRVAQRARDLADETILSAAATGS